MACDPRLQNRIDTANPAGSEIKNVKTGRSQRRKKRALSPEPKLVRTTFQTSREMDFFSEKELVTQTGHPKKEWPLVIGKELLDNALDACEEADVAPVIDVTADASGIGVQDNGTGLPESTLSAAMDFSVRASNREAYVAPDRGAQGNALKTILSMPWVLDPEHGRLVVEAHDKRHVIFCGADPISQRPVLHDDVSTRNTAGTLVRVEWPSRKNSLKTVWPFGDLEADDHADEFRHMVEGFALFNPHLTICLNWFGLKSTWKATDPTWSKWKPCWPTSAHWYDVQRLERLIGAYITHDRDRGADRLVSEFVAEFDGLTGSQKRSKVLRETNLLRVPLGELVDSGRLDSDRIGLLLAAMQRHTRPVNPRRLGIIGEEHLQTRLLAMGVKPASFRYSRKVSKCKKSSAAVDEKACFSDNLPSVLESAFGWLGDNPNIARRIYTGANWSAAIHNPFRTFGTTGEGLEAALSEFRVGADEPIVYVLHLAHPRIEYTDRGKSALVIGGESDDH